MIATSLLLSALLTPLGQHETKAFDLMVGDPAPAIAVADWIQGEPVTAFAPDQIYVVEFWATWCGPCRVAIPHMNGLQKEYGDKATFLGVSVWESLERQEEGAPHPVPAFVESMGDKMTYRVAVDRKTKEDEPHMANSWMRAAGQSGIPTAFIVNGAGKVAWIGHPMTIDEPLKAVVDGTWDLATFAKEYAADMAVEALVMATREKLGPAMKDEDFDGAIKVIDAAIAENAVVEPQFGTLRYSLLLQAERGEEAATYGRHLVADVIGDNPGALNNMAWNLVAPGRVTEKTDVALAVLAAARGCELTEEKDASLLDTYAVALWADGQHAKAIEAQEKAVTLSKGQRGAEEYAKRLAEFKAEIAKQL